MSDKVTVEPTALRSAGQALTTAATESGHAFDRHNAGLADAAAGLLPGSRAALQSKSAAWQTTASALVQRTDEHGTQLHTSAALYDKTDGKTSSALYDLTADRHASLNLDA